ncbi:carbohydrate ABC transporter membrane protein 1, CUT1 family [Tistlia consotensis]|uniref:sn-glycerol-3-phosphate transport system permease protein UgpA n=1 Tax=Tistlia consotensis USBA 355 TaxID=560819 RepID=A0A1Y6B7K3_9PROT|nr:sn-glycerol-3-phosphate ABC transporter permease UgpA [Tistlia consotensis]SME88513.1 carbohydrate ABC transporter membrane protein 1, CUT1 family [Tistlia consotensis USBA 355]SNR24984.1 carbohydrate ABC transporter membrane protein 1, CUT1 family [Tistlia consotensis]
MAIRGKDVVFKGRALPWLLLAPQLLVLAVFFFWPAGRGIVEAFFLSDPFLDRSIYVGLDNFRALFASPEYWDSVWLTLRFSAATTLLSMSVALALAVAADRVLRRSLLLRSLVIWPYAVAPAIAGMLWLFLFHPAFGVLALALRDLGVGWNPLLDGGDAMLLIVAAAAWKQVSYNFVFFLAGLQAIPASLIEAAAIDGAGPARRLRDLVLPLLGPTSFFLLVMNVIYAFFETFGIVDAITGGGPGGATRLLVYKVYKDGFQAQDLGSSAAQSIVLMVIVVALTILQFRFVEKRVSYA